MYMDKAFVRRNKVSFAILLFLVAFSTLHYMKPELLYTKDGGFREFGLGYNHKTVLPIWIFAIVFGILSYLAVSYYLMFG